MNSYSDKLEGLKEYSGCLALIVIATIVGVFYYKFSYLPEKAENIKNEEANVKKEKLVAEFISKYAAITIPVDSFSYSYEYLDISIDTPRLFVIKGKIEDIEKVDTNYLIKIFKDGSPIEITQLITDKAGITLLRKSIDKKGKQMYGVFVLKLSSYKDIKRTIEVGTEETDAYFTTDLPIRYLKGKLVDFLLEDI